ncbi:hypothetical protein OG884_05905 [Streptosporangium sp. NBC_01755]|uniref:hypothetical protein n=1 Tax=Streptosporangium sp. NBC_01755 TaxID=2975949 RepID=UPI002DD98DB6|nr:hypothetical protein [Streptosporangium sp. NBC_01755]WSD01460.1 hypothetical protein OG884_05905 [Streptosporangium sp. NBC_01755]
MRPTALVSATETSKTFRITCGGCKRTLDVILDVADAVKALTRSPHRAPLPCTARQVLAASLLRDEMLAEEPDHVETLVKGILLDLDEHGLEIVQSDAEVLRRARPDRPPGW